MIDNYVDLLHSISFWLYYGQRGYWTLRGREEERWAKMYRYCEKRLLRAHRDAVAAARKEVGVTVQKLFDEYASAKSDAALALSQRGNNYGIMVNKDELAQEYQLADARARVAERKLKELWGIKPVEECCDTCGWPVRICACNEPPFAVIRALP